MHSLLSQTNRVLDPFLSDIYLTLLPPRLFSKWSLSFGFSTRFFYVFLMVIFFNEHTSYCGLKGHNPEKDTVSSGVNCIVLYKL